MPTTTRRSRASLLVRGGLRGAGGAHGDAAGGDAVASEDGGDGLGAGEAEHEVARLAAAAVGMAFDEQPCIRMMAEPVTQPGDACVVPANGTALPCANMSVTGSKQGGGAAGAALQ